MYIPGPEIDVPKPHFWYVLLNFLRGCNLIQFQWSLPSLPKEAFSNPPSVCPTAEERSSVDLPIIHANGMMAKKLQRNTEESCHVRWIREIWQKFHLMVWLGLPIRWRNLSSWKKCHPKKWIKTDFSNGIKISKTKKNCWYFHLEVAFILYTYFRTLDLSSVWYWQYSLEMIFTYNLFVCHWCNQPTTSTTRNGHGHHLPSIQQKKNKKKNSDPEIAEHEIQRLMAHRSITSSTVSDCFSQCSPCLGRSHAMQHTRRWKRGSGLVGFWVGSKTGFAGLP